MGGVDSQHTCIRKVKNDVCLSTATLESDLMSTCALSIIGPFFAIVKWVWLLLFFFFLLQAEEE